MTESPQHPRLATESIAGQRPYQEDAVLGETLPDGRTLVAVADGMGGHAAGEVASALALETLMESVREGRDLTEAFRLANERVQAKAQEPDKKGMGTTLVVMLLEGDTYRVANVGDSRAYLISGDGIRQITHDHSFVAEAVKRGQSREEAQASRWKDALTRSIGTDPDVEADLFGPFDVRPNTAILLCSDGLYKALSDQDLNRIYLRSGSPEGAAQSLVTSALEEGSDDNISVAIAEFGEVAREVPAGTMEFEWQPPAEAAEEEAQEEGAEEAGLGAGGRDASAPSSGGHGESPSSGRRIVVGAVLLFVVLAGLWALLGLL